ncbi:uncharacterized protein [Typha angustifolia]|uniref:uncharacterized protein isoform X1 n=1 Tax=Typha angustifolia TaxID=59011 RepID=UPI003C2AF2C5
MEGFYICGGFRRCASSVSVYHAASTSRRILMHTKHRIYYERGLGRKIHRVVCLRNASRFSILTHSFSEKKIGGEFEHVINDESFGICRPLLDMKLSQSKRGTKILVHEDQQFLVHDLDNSPYDSAKIAVDIPNKEIERRRKIGVANKGKTPWNKGRKHSEETRERIRKRTIEALSDPKVRKKMLGSPCCHSDQSKAKISSALRNIWKERLKCKRSQENCYMMWARSVAEAAKEGGHGQQVLDWDSYEKIKVDMISQLLQRAADVSRSKQIEKLRAERLARIRAENAAKNAHRTNEEEQKPQCKRINALSRKKTEDEKKRIALSKSLKLKERLTKFHHRKKQLERLISFKEMTIDPKQAIDESDMEIVMAEGASLTDQIQAVESRKLKISAEGIPASVSIDNSRDSK